ncbi:hypothetical protein GCM10012320_34040 [Sinomonas cellulolyticus]|uniref:Uncharacterized protein n=1 Tax=Sinomonas cellulolyticus TaxID=2801916 RepID=A0ABS1K7Q3_9MICC|nr:MULTISPECIES: hypothetical protein [Sinomonas]MBL0706932.1 hypothetical protein [Sinomonas cellulolyticus]GHG59812.1 hypothetical protein GCM10012320_34040 [Sinomonas sp. KCTC 49339]
MGTNASNMHRWYRKNFRGHALSITQLAIEFEDRDLQRALLNGHITRRIATIGDIRAYALLPYEKRVAALNAARYASAFNAASATPVVLALIALCVAFVPKQAEGLYFQRCNSDTGGTR